MQLPSAILDEVHRYFDAHHPAWHLARERKNPAWSLDDQKAWDAARKMFPTLKFRDEAGAGAEFITFHRDMMREYKWILDQHTDAGLTYSPWPSIPKDVADVIDNEFVGMSGYTSTGEKELQTLAETSSLDGLGSFMEPAPRADPANGRGLHDFSHGAVSEIEKKLHLPAKYSMGSPSTAHRNIVFYQLHGWIDELYASWQRAHGEQPDLSPKKPGMHGHDHMLSLDVDRDVSLSQIADAADRLVGFPTLDR